MGIQIRSTGSYLPELIVTNDDLSKFLDTSDEWISSRTGIRQRHLSAGESTSDMGAKAAKMALEKSGLRPEEIDLVICATVTPDVCVPMVASNIKKALGIGHAAAFDMNANCSSFVYAVTIAQSLMGSCGYRNALVIGSDTNSSIVDWTDRSTCVLFGDGAGAVVLSQAEGRGIISTYLGGAIDTEGALLCRNKRDNTPFDKTEQEGNSKLQMNGKGVMRFAIGAFEESVTAVTKSAGVSPDDIKLIVPHQANIRILQSAAKHMGISEDRIFVNIDQTANTSSATIPIALDEATRSGRLNRGDLTLLIAFGGGFSLGAVLLEW